MVVSGLRLLDAPKLLLVINYKLLSLKDTRRATQKYWTFRLRNGIYDLKDYSVSIFHMCVYSVVFSVIRFGIS